MPNVSWQRFLREQTLTRVREVDRQARKLRRKQDPDTLHDVRVAIRRLNECLKTFRDSYESDHIGRTRRQLRKWMKACGEARTIDITLELLGKADPELVQQRADLAGRLKRWKWEKLPARCRVRKSAQDPAAHARRLLPALAAEWFQAGDGAAAPRASARTVHQFRLHSKHLRYTLELFAEVARSDAQREALKAVQNLLGAIHDCVASIEILKGRRKEIAKIRRLQIAREAAFRAHWHSHFAAVERQRWITKLVI
jgi:CHAD domain-containing protein